MLRTAMPRGTDEDAGDDALFAVPTFRRVVGAGEARHFLRLRLAVTRSSFPLALPVTPRRVAFVKKQSLQHLVFGQTGGEVHVLGMKPLEHLGLGRVAVGPEYDPGLRPTLPDARDEAFEQGDDPPGLLSFRVGT